MSPSLASTAAESVESPPPGALTRVVRGAGWSFAGRGLGGAFQFLNLIVLARALGSDPMLGLFFIAQSGLQMLSELARLGLDLGLVRFVAYHRGRDEIATVHGVIRGALRCGLTASVVLGVVLFLLAPVIERGLRQTGLAPVLRGFSAVLPGMTIMMLLAFALQSLQAMHARVKVEHLVLPLSLGGLLILSACLRAGATGAIVAYALAYLIATFAGAQLLRRELPGLWQGPARADLQPLIRFSLPLLGSRLLGQIMLWSDVLVLGYFVSAAQVAVFGVAARVALVVPLIMQGFAAVFAPLIAEHHGRGELAELQRLFQTVNRWTLSLTLPVAALLIAFPSALLGLFRPTFTSGAPCLIILAMGHLLVGLTGLAGYVLMMTGHSRLILGMMAATTAVKLTLMTALIPTFGIRGAAVSVAVSLTLLHLTMLLAVWWLLHAQPFTSSCLRPLAAVMGGLLAGLALHRLNLPAAAVSFLLVYALVLWRVGLDEDDRALLPQLLRASTASEVGTPGP